MNERLRCKAQVANAAWQGYGVVIVGANGMTKGNLT
jgi:hypothetical protein